MWYAIRLSRRKKIVKQGEKCPLTQYEAHKYQNYCHTNYFITISYYIMIKGFLKEQLSMLIKIIQLQFV